MRMLIRDILERDGYRIVEAENGTQALQKVSTDVFDCVMLDLIMPDISGLKILKYLKENRPGIPVIIVTAHLQESVREHCLQLGAAAFINKPFSKDELRHEVKRVVGLRRNTDTT
jgi:two-component system response regulator (stage 0 sporulation protein F)